MILPTSLSYIGLWVLSPTSLLVAVTNCSAASKSQADGSALARLSRLSKPQTSWPNKFITSPWLASFIFFHLSQVTVIFYILFTVICSWIESVMEIFFKLIRPPLQPPSWEALAPWQVFPSRRWRNSADLINFLSFIALALRPFPACHSFSSRFFHHASACVGVHSVLWSLRRTSGGTQKGHPHSANDIQPKVNIPVAGIPRFSLIPSDDVM